MLSLQNTFMLLVVCVVLFNFDCIYISIILPLFTNFECLRIGKSCKIKNANGIECKSTFHSVFYAIILDYVNFLPNLLLFYLHLRHPTTLQKDMVNKQLSSKHSSTHSMTSVGQCTLIKAIPLLRTLVELCQTLFGRHVFTYLTLHIFFLCKVEENSVHVLSWKRINH